MLPYRVLAVALLAFATPIFVPASSGADPVNSGFAVPERDSFYAPPADLGSYSLGGLINSRAITTSLRVPVSAWQLAFRSNDSRDQPRLAVTTVLVPLTPWPGPGPRPAVSVQVAEDSTGAQCAPSYQLASGGFRGDTVEGLLARNWAVAVPDHEGPESAFLAGMQAGHTVLDGLRAIEQFGAADLGPDTRWGLTGYSGGGFATAWAAQLQPGYAPELTFAGAAIGGLPADLPVVAANVDGSLFAGFGFGAMVGLRREFPEADIDSVLNDRGRADLARADGKCMLELLANFPFQSVAAGTALADPWHDPRLITVLQHNSLGEGAPVMPIYSYHSMADEVVPVGQDDDLVRTWRGRDADIVIVRDPVGTHAQEASKGQAGADDYLAGRFAAVPR
ncbi:lipase family protein [Nocardia sp. NPDC006630]|uniref:lipase family protein n=1 Tax=Nocardia sp. NPDC006630 TaxID=3157181 RepID=UPI0033BADB7A